MGDFAKRNIPCPFLQAALFTCQSLQHLALQIPTLGPLSAEVTGGDGGPLPHRQLKSQVLQNRSSDRTSFSITISPEGSPAWVAKRL